MCLFFQRVLTQRLQYFLKSCFVAYVVILHRSEVLVHAQLCMYKCWSVLQKFKWISRSNSCFVPAYMRAALLSSLCITLLGSGSSWFRLQQVMWSRSEPPHSASHADPIPSPPYLLISQLKIVVGDSPVEVLHYILADFMHGLRAEFLLDASVHARSSPEDHVEEAQVREGFIKRMLVLAPQPAPDSGAPDLCVAAERSLHVAHHIAVVAVVKRPHRAVIQKVVRLQESCWGWQHDGEQDHWEDSSRWKVSIHPLLRFRARGATGGEQTVSHNYNQLSLVWESI